MSEDSRTTKSLKNAQINIIYFFAQMIVGFWSRKVFYDNLGSEVLGLDTTAQSLLSLLNIAESGVCLAVAYFLYTPFYEKDKDSINKIVALQGWIYRRIATFILVLALVLMLFFPLIFKNIQVPLWYAYATFLVLLIGNLLDYFVNYRQSVLSADQKTYKVVKVTQFSSIAFRVFLIVYLPFSSSPFLVYLSTTLLGYIIASLWLNYVLKKEYPWLSSVKESGRELMSMYPGVVKKTKQLFVQSVGLFVIYQCAPLIMYSFSSLKIIAYYGNYLTVTQKCQALMDKTFSSTTASIGNLIASKDKPHMLKVFWELVDSRMFISTVAVFVLSIITEPFITLWLSSEYLLGKTLLLLVLFNVWLSINRGVILSFKYGFGIYQDIYAPLAESIINISVSVLGGFMWGINGVLLGGITSFLTVVYFWQPYFVFKKGFEISSIKYYFKPYFKRILLAVIPFFILYKIFSFCNYCIDSYIVLFVYSCFVFIVSFIIYFILFYLFTPGMRDFYNRIKQLIMNKVHW